MSSLVLHQGRWVSRQWLARYGQPVTKAEIVPRPAVNPFDIAKDPDRVAHLRSLVGKVTETPLGANTRDAVAACLAELERRLRAEKKP